MLATLNLQFTPLEITDETLAIPAVTPKGEPGSGFADLLRLRVDAGAANAGIPGEFLPPGGSELPLQALPIELDSPVGVGETLLPVGEPAVSTEGLGLAETLVIADSPELTVEPAQGIPVVAPTAPNIRPTETTGLASLAPAPDLESGLADRGPGNRRDGLPVLMPTQPVLQKQDLAGLTTEGADSHGPVLRARPVIAQVQAATTPVLVNEESAIPVDLPRRTDATPVPVVSSRDIGQLLDARPTVKEPVQVLGSQPNPQQAPLVQAPTTSAPVDTGYAAVAQQASDLISTPVRDRAWGDQIGERVLLMAGNQMKSAEIRLTPAELGPLRVQVSVDDGAANVTFQAQHAVTREAIEQALPRLRELLAENGLSLGQANVGEHAEGNRDQESGSLSAAHDGTGTLEEGISDDAPVSRRTVSSNSLLDTFV